MNDPTLLSRDQLEAHQLEQLNHLLREIMPANPFYAPRLKEAGLALPLRSLEEFTQAVPFTTKPELEANQQAHPPYGHNLTYPLDRYTRYHQTSGTSGKPLRWLDTRESWQWMVNNWKVVMQEARVHPGDHVFFAFSFGPFLGFWTAFEAAEQLGCLCISGGGMSSAARLSTMMANRTNVLCCTPTYALRLAEIAQSEGIALEEIGVETILVAGEPGGSVPATRNRIKERWPGVRIFDHHGMTEVGPVSFESYAHPGILHIIETAYLAEIIDPVTGEPAPHNQAGELVLTPLGRAASPLLRYRTNDFVQPSFAGQEQYGRNEMALVGGILCRVDDMVIIRGVNVYPSAVDAIMRQFDEVVEYRVEIYEAHSLAEMKVLCELHPECQNAAEAIQRIQTAFSQEYNLRVPIEAAAPQSLPRFDMKAKRWIRM